MSRPRARTLALEATATRQASRVWEIEPVKPCGRCPIPNIDPATAQSHPAVGDTLQTYRQDPRLNGSVTFGMNAIVLEGDGWVLRPGQVVRADWRFD